ncbi:MAG TPA: DUF1003 domain-containing protein [Ignavibacteria bacterium]|nr:DUF1003 domain-containing protein [Ignavibacteria bacterium]
MNHPALRTLKEIREHFKPIQNFNEVYKENQSKLNRIALWITNHVGSMGFFIIVFVWTIAWLGWNTLAPKDFRFDPYPGFVLWLFVSNVIQIFLMPLIMIGQNMQSDHSDARAENDFKINVKAEAEIETILENLESQNTLILQLMEELKKKG